MTDKEGAMSVRIYSRLGDVLRHRGVSVIELRTSVADRFGIVADRRTLARWARPSRVRRLDLELAWAIASVLGVPLEEVFTAEEPTDDGSRPGADSANGPLDPARERRLRELYRLQGDRGLSDVEREEMSVLVAEYNHRAYERGVRAIAARDGREVTEVAATLDAERARVATWYAELDADPARREVLVREALERQRARVDH